MPIMNSMEPDRQQNKEAEQEESSQKKFEMFHIRFIQILDCKIKEQ